VDELARLMNDPGCEQTAMVRHPARGERGPRPIGPAALVTSLVIGLAAPFGASCGAFEHGLDQARGEEAPARTQGLAPALPAQDALTTIARLEDARSDGDGLLAILCASPDAAVRERAATALGRLPARLYGAEVTPALERALDDGAPEVRAAAAFALGMRADPAAEGALLEHARDPDPRVRARVVEAASKVGTGRLRTLVLAALEDPSAEVRVEAVTGPHRWASDAQDAGEVDRALIAHARRGQDPQVLWRALFTLERRGSADARDLFLDCTAAPTAEARIFAVKGLARLAPDAAGREALEAALASPDWRVACEGLRGLERAAHATSIPALETALGHPSSHVRGLACSALGSLESERERVWALLRRARGDESASVRAAALVAQARLDGARFAPELRNAALEHDPLVRAGAAAAAAELPAEMAVPQLLAFSHDSDRAVAGAAIEGLAGHASVEARARVVEVARGEDDGLRLAALLTLRAWNDGDVAVLRAAFALSTGDAGSEARFTAVESAARIPGADSLAFLRAALDDPHAYVREVASAALAERGEPARGRRAGSAPTELPPLDAGWRGDGRPRVEIVTTRGTLAFELFADEAPVHVFNFLTLAAQDHYDGLSFHRVVPDFVVQGGCHRGDGNGSVTWRGDALRHEISPRKFTRGTLGMPRNEYLESGGSQFFVTHRPTPHLDGLYTIFGQLARGEAVLDALEAGDRILDVRRLD